MPATAIFPSAASARNAAGAVLAALLLGSALLLGGGGSPAPLPEMMLEWLAVAVAALWLVLPATRDDWRSVPRSAWMICLLALAVPLAQLVPLPPALWHSLPGREVEVDALSLIGRQDSWRPWSMAPDRTLAALLSLLPPLVLIVLVTSLAARDRLVLTGLVVLTGLASLAVGALQLTASPESAVQFYGVTSANLRGFQANHNSTADLLLAAMLATILLIRSAALRGRLPDRSGPVLGLAAMAIALFGFGVIFTASRMGIALAPLAVLAALWLLRGWLPSPSRKTLALGLGGLAVAAAGLLALFQFNPAMAAIGQRFDFQRELRVELWKDGIYVARKHYPVGVGMGNFVPALIADERLEVVRPLMPNRAHNEYIELTAEAGLPGLLAWGVVIALVAAAAWHGRGDASRLRRGEAIFAGSVLALLLIHSMVDYPFRSMSLACLGGLCAAMLLAGSGPARTGSNGKDDI